MHALRACSGARVVFVILPTLFGLLEPHTTLAEQHYTSCARRHGAALINGYNILRTLGGLHPEGPSAEFLKKINRVDAAFNLNDRGQLALRWLMRQRPAELQGARIGTKAFCEQAFEDNIHVSRAFHEVIAGLLYRWMCRKGSPNRPIGAAHAAQDWVVRCQPSSIDGFNPVDRTNSLISRQLLSLSRGDVVIFPCPREYRVASLLLNASRTSAFLHFASPLGNACIDVRFREQPNPWIAAVARIPETLGPEENHEAVGAGIYA